MKIGVIGGKGLFGSWFARFFSAWYPEDTILVSDLDTPLTNTELAQQADVMLLAVPIMNMVPVIREIAPVTHENQLIVEIASANKEAILKALTKTSAEFLQIHPMCRPPKKNTLSGFSVITAEESRQKAQKAWADTFLAKTQGKIMRLSAEKMDRYAALVQVAIHMPLLAYLKTMMAFQADTNELFQVASGFYRIMVAAVLRLIKQEPTLYWNLAHENPYAKATLDVFEDELKGVREMLARDDFQAFERIFQSGRKFAGEKNLEKGFSLFDTFTKIAETEWNEK